MIRNLHRGGARGASGLSLGQPKVGLVRDSAPSVTAGSLRGSRYAVLLASVTLVGCLLWSYWPTLVELRGFWARNQDYSVGQLVPLVALYLVWRERAFLLAKNVRPCW